MAVPLTVICKKQTAQSASEMDVRTPHNTPIAKNQNHLNDVGMGNLELRGPLMGIRFEWSQSLTSLSLFQDTHSQNQEPWLVKSTLWPLPKIVADAVTLINRFFLEGIPIEQIPWELLDISQMTPFQRRVYEATGQIPHGQTRPYSWIADRIGSPKATRAIGQALKRNPFAILIPCHRVTSMQDLGGFMGESDPNHALLHIKRNLIHIEEKYHCPVFPFFH